jgi:hypothetical protein
MGAGNRSGDGDGETATRVCDKLLDGLAWLIAAVALCAGLLCASAVGLFGSAWLFQGRSFRSLVWTLSDQTWLVGMAKALGLASGLGLSAIALACRGQRYRSRVSMAAFAVRLGRGCLVAVVLAAVLSGIPVAFRLAAFLGLTLHKAAAAGRDASARPGFRRGCSALDTTLDLQCVSSSGLPCVSSPGPPCLLW